jgi:hypothetical protein
MSRPTEWTDSETEAARANYHLPPDEFRRKTGRTKQAAKAHLRYVSRPEVRERKNAQKVALRLARKENPLPKVELNTAVAPPPEVIIDAIKRASAPRTLTAIICGDPAPGFSALERRA